MAYITCGDYITEAKGLAQDVSGVRYSMSRYYQALNAGLAEAYRVRPDFFRGVDVPPSYGIGDDNETVNWPRQFALPLVYYIVGHLELSDAEGNQESRAAALITTYINKLTKPGM